jgi:hypothetical protein
MTRVIKPKALYIKKIVRVKITKKKTAQKNSK